MPVEEQESGEHSMLHLSRFDQYLSEQKGQGWQHSANAGAQTQRFCQFCQREIQRVQEARRHAWRCNETD